MEELKILKGNRVNLPNELNENTIYVATADTFSESTHSEIIIGNKVFVSKEYVDSLASTFLQKEIFDGFREKINESLTSSDLATINGQEITKGGDIEIRLDLVEIVDDFPNTSDDNFNPNKIYLIKHVSGNSEHYDEYVYNGSGWHMLGSINEEIHLTEYLTKNEAESMYLKKNNGTSVITIAQNGSLANYGDNGQAFNAIRDCGSNSITGSKINGGSFGVKLDGNTSFSHKTYTSFDKNSGSYIGAKNTAVLSFSGSKGLRYAKNTSSNADVTEDMYRHVGVIDSQDENNRVYSKMQVDTLINEIKKILIKLGATTEDVDMITI